MNICICFLCEYKFIEVRSVSYLGIGVKEDGEFLCGCCELNLNYL